MSNFAIHMRISGTNVSNEDMESRQAATKTLSLRWGKDNKTPSILAKVAEVAESLGGDGTPSAELGAEIQVEIQKKSPAFLYDEHLLDVGICAGMAMVAILSKTPGNTGWLIADVYAAALWSALSYQPVLAAERRESLRSEVLKVATNWCATSSENARSRPNVPDPSKLEITLSSENVYSSNFMEAMASTIETLRRNAALDREELDFLWWVQVGRSRLLKRQWSEIQEPVRIVTAAIEGSALLRRLPCEAHREIILGHLGQNPELNLVELLAALDNDRESLCIAFPRDTVATHPSIFPLLHALDSGAVDTIGATIKRRVSEWGERALLESTFAKLISEGPGKV
jgi:hypothetical protein